MLELTENALTTLKARYLLPGETPKGMFWRVARGVASAETMDKEQWAETFFELMTSLKFLPNSPTLFNAGTGQGTLSACFVLPVEDTMESIMEAATASAMIQKYGGGLGYSFSKLRPRGTPIRTTQGKACGAIAVLKMFSSLSDMITQGGKRHGANMAILSVSHPEIMEFIHMKDDDKTAQNFNISVAVTDAFMQAVKDDTGWDLVVPLESEAENAGEVVRTLLARQIWTEIVESAWKTGDPGLYFIDEANRHNPTPHLGDLDSTNPCGEVPLLANEACNLGSIDLGRFVTSSCLDFEELKHVVRIATRFLDDVVTVNAFPTQAVTDVVASTRKLGLGVMGWHDALIRLGIPYDSQAALDLADDVMRTINNEARLMSLELGEERGSYPAWRDDSPDSKVPIRNATRTCIAPTGTISIIAGASGGIEPIFAIAFVKNVLDEKHLFEVNTEFERMAKDRGFYSEELIAEVAKTGSCQHLSQVPDDVKRLFMVANEIAPEWHVKMQAVFQKHTDLAVSKTINMANSATKEEIEESYWLAHTSGCKGITIYRDGSKSIQVLEVQRAGPAEINRTDDVSPRSRPNRMYGFTERMNTGHGATYVTVNLDDEGLPFEVFTTVGKAGGCDSANLEAVSRLTSLALRSGIPVEEVIDQLQGITCHPVWDRGIRVLSAPDALAKVLRRYEVGKGVEILSEQPRLLPPRIESSPVSTGEIVATPPPTSRGCPECGGLVVYQEGCVKCQRCHWNKCG